MIEGTIRPIAVAAIRRRGGEYLVHIFKDRSKKINAFRMLGGGIEFGETAKEAVRREFMEEIGAEVRVGRRLAVRENIFTFEGRKGHEIVFVFEAEFADRSLYDTDKIPMIEEAYGGEYAVWIKLGKVSHYGELPPSPSTGTHG